jgi:hypothetical protein
MPVKAAHIAGSARLADGGDDEPRAVRTACDGHGSALRQDFPPECVIIRVGKITTDIAPYVSDAQ